MRLQPPIRVEAARIALWRRPARLSPLLLALLLPFCIHAQDDQQPPPAGAAPKPAHGAQGANVEARPGYQAGSGQEVTTRDSPTTFKVRVNLVLVRVVVRDEHGKIIDNLKKEDFQIFDNRKPQTISSFSMETPLSHSVPLVSASDRDSGDSETQPAPNLPQRFVSLFFDDLHIAMEDALNVRTAAVK